MLASIDHTLGGKVLLTNIQTIDGEHRARIKVHTVDGTHIMISGDPRSAMDALMELMAEAQKTIDWINRSVQEVQ